MFNGPRLLDLLQRAFEPSAPLDASPQRLHAPRRLLRHGRYVGRRVLPRGVFGQLAARVGAMVLVAV